MKLGSRLWAIVIMVMFIMMLCLPVMAVNIVPTGVSAGVGGLSTNGGELGIKTTAGAYLFRVVKGTGVTTASAPFQGTSTIYGAVDPVVYNVRVRSTAAEIGAGKTLVAVPTGLSFRLIDCKAIAYGGAVATTTTVDILDGSTKLVAFAQASLTQSTVLTAGGTGAAVLADGASYVKRTAGNDITIGKTGGAVETATGVDVILTYTLE